MIAIFLMLYNIIIKECYHPQWWLKIVDITIEKGKGLVLGKFRNIQLIKAALQILMRIYLRLEGEELIKKDQRISKANYESRKNYSIESVILKK